MEKLNKDSGVAGNTTIGLFAICLGCSRCGCSYLPTYGYAELGQRLEYSSAE